MSSFSEFIFEVFEENWFLYFINFSPMLSMAIFLGVTTKTLLSNFINWRIYSTIVVVFPVLGGPWINPISFNFKANVTISFWLLFNPSLKKVKFL